MAKIEGSWLKTEPMTHKQLVRRIAAWMKNSKHAVVVLTELVTQRTSETPDVLGFFGAAASTLVECKTSRADFRADAKKHFRREEERGMGDRRYFAAPKGVLDPDDMPDGWGMLSVEEHCVRELVSPEPKTANKAAECMMLMSALRRLEISTAVYVVHEE